MSPARRFARTLALAAVSIVLLGLILFATPYPEGLPIRWGPLLALSVTGVVGWIAAVARPSGSLTPPAAAAALLVGAAAVSAIASPYPSLAVSAVWHMATLAGTGLLIWRLASRPDVRRDLIALLAIFLVVLIGAYLVQVVGFWRDWLALGMPLDELPLRPGAAGGLVGIPTWLGDYIVAATPVVAVSLGRQGGGARIAAVGLSLVALTAVLITGTRSLWLLVAMEAVVLVAMRLRTTRVSRRVVIAGAILAAGGLLVASRLDLLGRILRDADEGRSSAFASAIRIASQYPLLGGGPGAYGVHRLDEQVPVFAHYAFPDAHNLVLSALAETGLVGLGALVGAAILVVIQVRRVYRAAGPDRPVIVAAVAGLIVLLGHALVDVVVDVQGIAIVALIVAAFALVPQERTPSDVVAADGDSSARTLARGAALAVLVVMVVCLPFTARVELSVFRQFQSATTLASDPAQALNRAREAVDLAPDFAPAWVALSIAADAAGRPDVAIDAASEASRLEGLAQHRVVGAVLLDRAGRSAQALAEIRRAVDRDIQDPFVQLNGAVMLARYGEAGEAQVALTRLLELEPTVGLIASGLPADVTALLPSAREVALARFLAEGQYDAALQIALTSEDQQETLAVLAAVPFADRNRYALIAAAWTGSASAATEFERLVAADPSRSGASWWGWLLAAHRCDAGAVARWGQVHRILGSDYPRVPVEVGTTPSVEADMQPPLYPTAAWQVGGPKQPYVAGTWVYRSGTPACQLSGLQLPR